MKNPQLAAQKWAQNFAAAGPAVQAGVQAVTEAPTLKAAARQDAYVRGVQAAANSGKWAAGLRKVSLQSWQQSMLTKGVQNMNSGAQAGKSKMQAHLAAFIPHMEMIRAQLDSMPTDTTAQQAAKVAAVIEHAKAFAAAKASGGM